MGAFDGGAFGPGFGLLSSGEPSFQGVAFDGDAFHIQGAPAEAESGHPARAIRRRLPEVVRDDDEELLLALI